MNVTHVSTNILFLFQDPIQDTKLHLELQPLRKIRTRVRAIKTSDLMDRDLGLESGRVNRNSTDAKKEGTERRVYDWGIVARTELYNMKSKM